RGAHHALTAAAGSFRRCVNARCRRRPSALPFVKRLGTVRARTEAAGPGRTGRHLLNETTGEGRGSMDIGIVLQTTPPAARVIELSKRADALGFSHVWTFDSHILWEEPYVIYSQILAETRNVVVGPMVTNPATRDWTVTASLFATLNEMYGNRTVCGIGRGDSAVRVTNGKPTTLATMGESIHVIRELANGRPVDYKGSTIT